MVDFWANRSVLVTGGAGFLSARLVATLTQRGCQHIFVPGNTDYDLREKAAIQRVLHHAAPDLIIHLAAQEGSIGAHQAHPAESFYDNLVMGVQLLHEAWQAGVPKFVAVGTVYTDPVVSWDHHMGLIREVRSYKTRNNEPQKVRKMPHEKA